MRIFDKFSFAKTALNMFIVDYDKSPECLGVYGLPAEKEEDLIYFLHQEIEPVYMASSEKGLLENATYL